MIVTGIESQEYVQTANLLLAAVLKKIGVACDIDIELELVGPEEIRALNAAFRETDRVTDVLSFPSVEFVLPFDKEAYADAVDPETGNILLGSILICEEVMRAQAEEYGHSQMREFAFLTLHGMLHLFGYDHEQEDDERAMSSLQEDILEAHGITR